MNLVELGKVAEFINGYAFKPSSWSSEGMKIIRIQNLTNPSKSYNRTKQVVQERYRVRKGDILVSWSATLGVFEWEDQEDALLNQHIFKVQLDSTVVDKQYFKYVLRYSIEKMAQFTHGSTMKHIVRRDFLNHQIPLPSLEDQKNIVKVIELAESLLTKRKKSIALLDNYLKSVFLDIFGDPVKNPIGWKTEKLGNVASKITDGTHKTPVYTKDGVKFISAKNIKAEEVTWKDIKFISQVEHDSLYQRCNPERNDLLLTKSGSLGMVALVDVDFEFSLFESVALIKVNQKLIDPIFLREYLNLKEIKSFYSQRTKGIGVKHLHLVDIKSLPVLLPPITDQQRFARLVQKVKTLKQKMFAQSYAMEIQLQSLMQKSFTSEL